MSLVDYDEIEMAHTEPAQTILHFVYLSHHRRIRRDVNPTIRELLRHQVYGIGIRQVLLKRVACLADESDSVGKKEYAFDPVAPLQQLAKSYDGPCLACARRHHDQCFSLHRCELLRYRADRFFLV